MWAHSQRLDEPLSVVMCDIDKFKSVNDTHGHQVGDIVLKDFACLLKEAVREIDRVGRYGGEEFLLLLPGTPLDSAVTFAERLREIVERAYIFIRGRHSSPDDELRRGGVAASGDPRSGRAAQGGGRRSLRGEGIRTRQSRALRQRESSTPIWSESRPRVATNRTTREPSSQTAGVQHRKRSEQLRDALNRASYEYYVLDRPKTSDAQYDKLFRELQELEAEPRAPHPRLTHSPHRQRGAERAHQARAHQADAVARETRSATMSCSPGRSGWFESPATT